MSASDQQLLQAYLERRSEAAFAELVRRHVDLVYSVAARMVCDAHLADDVTQRAFVALARNAGKLTNRPVLSGWLHRTAHNLAAETVRKDVRRRAREQEAAAMNELLAAEPNPAWDDIAPHLDGALDALAEPDRDAVLLRYFEGKSAREMAQTLGVSEEAAQKRVNRAVGRLREHFAERGIAVGTGALVVLITGNALRAAPAGLAAASSAAAVAAAGSSVGILTLMTMTKLQTAMAGVIVVGLVITPVVIHYQSRLRRENEGLRSQLAQHETRGQELSNQLARLKRVAALRASELQEPVAAAKPADDKPPFQRVTEFIESHYGLPRDQVEAYVQRNHRNLESLLAAFQVSHEPAYLREAATNAPNNPAVQFAVVAHNIFPDEQRKWIDAFRASSPDNALPWYFSALDYFKSKQPEQAIQELTLATRRQLYADYAAQTGQAVEELYDSAGWPTLAAKAVAPGSASFLSGPYLGMLKSLANETVELQQRYLNHADPSSASTMAAMGLQLAGQLRRANGPLDQLVGVAVEKKILGQLDPAGSYEFLGRPVSQALVELDQQRQMIREAIQLRDRVRPTLSESELNNYWDREKLYGEMYAMQWLQSQHAQH